MYQEESQHGFTFIELVVSIALLLVLAFVIDVLLINRVLQSRTGHEALAHQIAQEELEVLRNYPFNQLTTTTDGAFKGILFHKGTIAVTSSSDSLTAFNLVDIQSASSTVTTTAHLVFPKNAYRDVVINTDLRIFSDSPSSYGAGILFRSLDENNGYLLYLNSSNDIMLDLLVDSVVTNLYSQIYTVLTNTWYDLELTLSGDTISLNINTTPVFSISDSTFEEGYAAIVATDGAHIAIDNLFITESNTTGWDFDGYAEGKLPAPWTRPGLQDLPSSTARLNITNYLGSDKIKEVTAEIEWLEKHTTTSIEQTTLIYQN